MGSARDVRPKKGMGAKMAGGNPNAARGRDPDEFYPTPPEVTRALVDRYPAFLYDAVVWECCAGDGTMARTLLECGVRKVLATDIKPRIPVNGSPKLFKADVLATRKMPLVDAVVTNPPFDIAEEIIHHILALEDGPPLFLGLVLKATFWHAMRRAPLFQRFRPSAVHPLRWRPDFKNLGAPTMEIMWCVWSPRDPGTTHYEPLDRPKDSQ